MRFVWPRDFQLFVRECIKPLKNKKQSDVSWIGSSNACRSCSNSGVNVAYHDTSVFDRAKTRHGSSVATSILPRMFSIRSRGVGGPRPRTCFNCLCSVLLTFHGFGARLNWSGRSGSAHSSDLCFIGYVFFWVDRGGLRPAARAALARFLQ